MTGINKIREKIISEANDAARVIVEDARGKCIALSNEYAKRAEDARNAIDERAEGMAASIIEKTKAAIETEREERIEATKKLLIDESFVSARKEIDKLSEEKHVELLTSLAKKALFETIDKNPNAEGFELLLRKKDLANYGETILKSLCKKTDKKYGKGKKITLSNIPGKIDGGVMVRCGNVETDYSLSAIFERLRIELDSQIYKKLFENE